ncbi:MAG: hypothetical protein GEV10_18340 [Streptosporangiales bacterium]|nr:hypothetical protein [Streptosporangiales bacterium]
MPEKFEVTADGLTRILDLRWESTAELVPVVKWDPVLQVWVLEWVQPPIQPNWLRDKDSDYTTIPDDAGKRRYLDAIVEDLLADPVTVQELLVGGAVFQRLANQRLAESKAPLYEPFSNAAARLFTAAIDRLAVIG